LEAQGLSKEEIIDKYVFFTAGSCGPCRFGMYESENRMALESAGFGGFRVLLFSLVETQRQARLWLPRTVYYCYPPEQYKATE
jgi:predicted nucleotide-binding protein (sugar kinase/HSP70/actin superfamily)